MKKFVNVSYCAHSAIHFQNNPSVLLFSLHLFPRRPLWAPLRAPARHSPEAPGMQTARPTGRRAIVTTATIGRNSCQNNYLSYFNYWDKYWKIQVKKHVLQQLLRSIVVKITILTIGTTIACNSWWMSKVWAPKATCPALGAHGPKVPQGGPKGPGARSSAPVQRGPIAVRESDEVEIDYHASNHTRTRN